LFVDVVLQKTCPYRNTSASIWNFSRATGTQQWSGMENARPWLKTHFMAFGLSSCLFRFLNVDYFGLIFIEPTEPIRRIRRLPKAATIGVKGMGGLGKQE
jgi:hypothetical protein